jgi:hypothetical protein
MGAQCDYMGGTPASYYLTRRGGSLTPLPFCTFLCSWPFKLSAAPPTSLLALRVPVTLAWRVSFYVCAARDRATIRVRFIQP